MGRTTASRLTRRDKIYCIAARKARGDGGGYGEAGGDAQCSRQNLNFGGSAGQSLEQGHGVRVVEAPHLSDLPLGHRLAERGAEPFGFELHVVAQEAEQRTARRRHRAEIADLAN